MTVVPPSLAHKLMTKKEAAKEIGRSTREVGRLMLSGELKSFKHGKYVYITRSSVKAYVKLIENAIPV